MPVVRLCSCHWMWCRLGCVCIGSVVVHLSMKVHECLIWIELTFTAPSLPIYKLSASNCWFHTHSVCALILRLHGPHWIVAHENFFFYHRDSLNEVHMCSKQQRIFISDKVLQPPTHDMHGCFVISIRTVYACCALALMSLNVMSTWLRLYRVGCCPPKRVRPWMLDPNYVHIHRSFASYL
jgi:hypothetical protein